MKPIRVMVVDDQDSVRRGLGIYFEPFEQLELVGEAANGAEAVQLCDEIQPDVILMDIRMPGMDGITATRLIHAKHPRTQIIAFTTIFEDSVIRQMLEAGAYSYLLKDAPVADLSKAILSAGHASGSEN